METSSPVMNIAANKLAQKWLIEIKAQIDSLAPATQAGCWKVILDRCMLKRSLKTQALTREQMIENVEGRIRKLHEKFSSRWKWPNYYVDFSKDCGVNVEPAKDDTATRFADAVKNVINYDRYNLAQLLRLKERIVDAILIFYGQRRTTLTGAEANEGAQIADEWVAKMEAEIVDMELKGRERFWEKIALSTKEYVDRSGE